MSDFYHIDAFASGPFSGNPAAVVLLDAPAHVDWLRKVANEANLSETAFVVKQGDSFNLRWFTPLTEVDLCGHATLATAHALWESGRAKGAELLSFQTRSGLLTARRAGAGIELDFPAFVVRATAAPGGLLESLGITDPKFVGRDKEDYLVEVADEHQVQALNPDLKNLAKVDCRGVCVTAKASTRGADFVSRFFGPRVGVDEDPVTGSAHCRLAPYWGERLGKTSMMGRQLSARGGEVGVEVRGERVGLSGRAFTIWRGDMVVPPSA